MKMRNRGNDRLSLLELRNKLLQHYHDYRSPPTRRLFVYRSNSGNGGVGAFFFALEGTPPKGYAVYIPERRSLSLYNPQGERFSIYGEIEITDLDKIKDIAIIG